MRFTVNPKELLATLRVARQVVSSRPTLPVLGHVLLTANDNGTLTVAATNLEAHVGRVVPAVSSEHGAAALPLRPLLAVAQAFRGEPSMSIETWSFEPGKSRMATVSVGGGSVELAWLEADEFPAAPTIAESAGAINLEARTLRDLVEYVIRSAAPDDSRPVLAGVQIVAADGRLTIAAADGFRLSTRQVECWPGNLDALVPAATLALIAKTARKEDMLALEVGAGVLRVTAPDGSWWTSRQITGQFPDFRRIIPKTDAVKTTFTVKTAELVRVVGLAKALAPVPCQSDHILRLAVGDGAVTLTARRYESSVAASFPIAAKITGEATAHIAMRDEYVFDAVRDMGDLVTFEIVNNTAPVVIRAAGERTGTLRIVMPMHVGA